jgi:hypothetical protein
VIKQNQPRRNQRRPGRSSAEPKSTRQPDGSWGLAQRHCPFNSGLGPAVTRADGNTLLVGVEGRRSVHDFAKQIDRT